MITKYIVNNLNKGNNKSLNATNERNLKTFKESGISPVGSIVIPFTGKESRSVLSTSNTYSGNDFRTFEQAFYDNSKLKKAGARFLTNLKNNCSIPVLSKLKAYTETELGEAFASGNTPTVNEKKLSAGRISTVVEFSKQYLNQQSEDVEKVVADALTLAVNEKIEEEVLAQLGAMATSCTTVHAYSAFTAAEETLPCKDTLSIICSKAAKKALKNTPKTTSENIFNNNSIDCYPTFVSDNMQRAGRDLFIVGDWSQIVVGIWGVDITTDDVSKAKEGLVRVIVNAYVDWDVLDIDSFAFCSTYKDETENVINEDIEY